MIAGKEKSADRGRGERGGRGDVTGNMQRGGWGWQALSDKSHQVPVLSEREMSSVSVLWGGGGGEGGGSGADAMIKETVTSLLVMVSEVPQEGNEGHQLNCRVITVQ